jgi:hypothetical protein
MSTTQIHGGGTTQIFDGQGGADASMDTPIQVDPAVTQAVDRMIAGIKAGIALQIPEWGGRTWDELEQAVFWWGRAKQLFKDRIDIGWVSVHEPAIHPKNSARSLKLWMSFPAWIDGNITRRETYPRSYATKIGADGRGLAEALRTLIESSCQQ